MGVIARGCRNQEGSSFHNVVTDEGDEHGVFDVVIKSVAIADAIEGKAGC